VTLVKLFVSDQDEALEFYTDRRDIHKKTQLPRVPYLLQGAGHPSVIGVDTIRGRLRQLSTATQACRADGSPLMLEPHDCRRVVASEHLNSTPVHVIAALLGHYAGDPCQVDHGWFRYRRAAAAGERLSSWPISAQVWPWSRAA
jgi:integrase